MTLKQKQIVKRNEKVIGVLRGGVFYKSVVGSKHKLRQPPAWAIDAEAFDREVKPNAIKIVVIDREANIEYHASAEVFARYSFRFNRGFGDQYALPLEFFQVRNNENGQLSLWGGDGNA